MAKQILAVFHTSTKPLEQEIEAFDGMAKEWEPRVHRRVITGEGLALEIALEADERTPEVKALFRQQALERFAAHLKMIVQRDFVAKSLREQLAPFFGKPMTPETRENIRTRVRRELYGPASIWTGGADRYAEPALVPPGDPPPTWSGLTVSEEYMLVFNGTSWERGTPEIPGEVRADVPLKQIVGHVTIK